MNQDSKGNYWHQRRLVRRRTVLQGSAAGLIGLGGLATVGCGDDDDDADPTSAANSPDTATSPETSGPPTGLIRAAHPGGALRAFNPLSYTSGAQYLYLMAISDGLLNVGKKNGDGFELYPALAKSYETSPDGLTWTFKLNNAARFHDGNPVTSADVKFTWEMMLNPDPSVRHARKSEVAAILERVDTPDELTAVIHLKSPYLLMKLRSNNWPIISSKQYQTLGADGFEAKPVAAGPFKFVSGTKDQRVALTAVTDHYRKIPAIKDYEIEIVPEAATSIARLEAGETDIVQIEPASKKQVESISGARVVSQKGIFGTLVAFMDQYLGLDTPTADRRVRKAMSTAINRESIVKSLLSGEALLGGSFGLPHVPGYLELPIDKYSIEQAKALLSQAGHPDGFDVDLYVQSPVKEYVAVLQADWQKIGVRTTLKPLDAAAFAGMYAAHKTPGVLILDIGSTYVDPAELTVFIFKNGIASYLKDFDAEAKVISSGLVEEDRIKAFKSVQQKVYDETLYAPLWYSNVLTAVSKKVKEWDPIPPLGFILRMEYARV